MQINVINECANGTVYDVRTVYDDARTINNVRTYYDRVRIIHDNVNNKQR